MSSAPESEGGGCLDPQQSKRENHKFHHSELPGTPSRTLPDWTTVTSSFKHSQTGTCQPCFLTCVYWTQRKLLPGKSICNKASWNMSYSMALLGWLNIIHSSFCPSAQAEHLHDTWILVEENTLVWCIHDLWNFKNSVQRNPIKCNAMFSKYTCLP